jgi:Flp pilus assembly protein TadB
VSFCLYLWIVFILCLVACISQRYRQQDTERRQSRDTGNKTQNEDNPEIQATRHRTKTIQRYRQKDTERRQSRPHRNHALNIQVNA